MRILCLFFLLLVTQVGFAQSSVLLHDDIAHSRTGSMNINPDWAPFYHGVASGDPLEDRVIIWTRVTPEEMNGEPVEVDWVVATDPGLENIVKAGTFTTNAERDYTVKVDVTGLEAGSTYYYGFSAFERNSLVGRTKTTPSGEQSQHLRFAVVSCNNYEHGYFNGFKRIAERNDLDAVIHLGDYIYEQAARRYGSPDIWEDERVLEPEQEIVSVEEYRTRYSLYRLDTMLVRAHQQHPFITIWDDHESANDAWTGGAQAHNADTEGTWEERLATAKQVYFEWMPIRDTETQSVFRKISYGNLADLILLDTRIEGREQQILDVTDPALTSPDRTILGAEQKAWLKDQLSNSSAQWKIIAQQVLFAELNVGWAALQDTATTFEEFESTFLDIWDGYPAERTEIVNFIKDNNLEDVVILTGDFHTTFAFEVADPPANVSLINAGPLGAIPFYTNNPGYDPQTGEGAVAVEFATPSISSANFDENLDLESSIFFESIINQEIVDPGSGLSIGNPNPHMKYTNLIDHGYYVLDVTPAKTQADYYFMPILEVTEEEYPDSAAVETGFYFTNTGKSFLQRSEMPAALKEVQDLPAPADPPAQLITSLDETVSNGVILGVYPNPFTDSTNLHYSLTEKARVRIELLDANGRLIKVLMEETLPQGIYTLQTPAGTYVYRMLIGGKEQQAQVVLKR